MARSLTLAGQVAALRRTLLQAITARLALSTDRPFVQLLALHVVQAGEVETQAQLAERLLIDPPAASRLVTRLERDGLLVRSAGKDRRCICLKVTAAGRAELKALQEASEFVEARVRRSLSRREYDELMRLSDKLSRALTAPQ